MARTRGPAAGSRSRRASWTLALLTPLLLAGCTSLPSASGHARGAGSTADRAARRYVAPRTVTELATDEGTDSPQPGPAETPARPAGRSRRARTRAARRRARRALGALPAPIVEAVRETLADAEETAGSPKPATPPGFTGEFLLTSAEVEPPSSAPGPVGEAEAIERKGGGEPDDDRLPEPDSPVGDEGRSAPARGERLAQRPRAGAGRPADDEFAELNRGDEDDDDTEYDRPRAERPGGGGAPTRSSEDEEKRELNEDEDEALYKTRLLARALGLREDSAINVFGWFQGGFTGNPSRPRDGLNVGVNPNFLANRWTAQQLYFVVERLVDLEEDYDFGFRIDSIFGTDYSQLHMTGFFENAFPPTGYGFELTQFYAEAHLPWLTEDGLEVKVGRFFALAGYEDARAPARPLNSASYLFGYSHPFTHVGALTILHVNDQVNLYNGAVNGWDRWINQNYRWGYVGGVSWDSKDGRTSFTTTLNVSPNQFPRFFAANNQLAPNGVTQPPFLAGRRNLSYNNDQSILFTNVLIHKWTDRYTLIVENDEGYDTAVPGLGPGGTVNHAAWYGLAGWNLYRLTEKVTGVYRAEVFRDQNGARTGFDDTFYEMTLGLIIKPKPWFWVRPEVRYDWATGDDRPYSGEHSRSQFTLGFDTIFIF